MLGVATAMQAQQDAKAQKDELEARAEEANVEAQNRELLDKGAEPYQSPGQGGGITGTYEINGKTINFGHGGRHLDGTGLNVNKVNEILANEVANIHPGTGLFYKGTIEIGGITIEYTSYGVSDGVINIGTYYPIN